jgi:hypothetical protein
VSGVPVLRLAPTTIPRRDREADLAALFGERVEIFVATNLDNDVPAVVVAAREIGAQAVLADAWRGDLEDLCRVLAPTWVLRPMYDYHPTPHGPPAPRFSRYARRWPGGDETEMTRLNEPVLEIIEVDDDEPDTGVTEG